MRQPDLCDRRVLPSRAYLMALGLEVLLSPFVPAAHELLNVKEIVEDLLSKKLCTGNLLRICCTLNTDLSLYLRQNSSSVHTLWSWVHRSFFWMWKLERVPLVHTLEASSMGWATSPSQDTFVCPACPDRYVSSTKSFPLTSHHNGNYDLWAACSRDAYMSVWISTAKV